MKTKVLDQSQKVQGGEDFDQMVEQGRKLHDRAVFEALVRLTGLFGLIRNKFSVSTAKPEAAYSNRQEASQH